MPTVFKPHIAITDIEEAKLNLNKTIYSLKNGTSFKPFGLPNYKYTNQFIKNSSIYINGIETNSPNKSYSIMNLRNNIDIVIKPADKNIGTTVINKEVYIDLCLNHLEDKNTYTKLVNNPLVACRSKIVAMLNMLLANKFIDLKTFNILIPKEPRLGLFYGLLKLHKEKLGLRPIVSQIGHPTRPINIFLHNILEIITREAYTAIKNSYELVKGLKEIKYNSNLVLISADITSLYTSIPTKWGISNLLNIYNKYKNKIGLDSLALNILVHNVLTQNVFEFNDNFYLQKEGTAMGSNLAPTYAGCVLRNIEENWLLNSIFSKNLTLFKRYIDDIFIIFNNENNNLNEFLSEFNNVYKPLELTVVSSKNLIDFLDLTIMLNHSDGIIETKLFKKKIGQKEPIPFDSCHPKHILLNTLSGEALRADRLNSNKIESDLNKIILFKNALNKGYPFRKTKRAIYKSLYSKEKELNIRKSEIKLTYQGIQTDHIKRYLQKTWSSKYTDNRLRVGMKLNKNLKRLLTHPKI